MTGTGGDSVSRKELLVVIADFISMGHLENIQAMFRQDPGLYQLSGELISDERFMVRMGMVVLFEELARDNRQDLHLALPSLLPKLGHEKSFVRGDTATLLGIIGTGDARRALEELLEDDDAQVVSQIRDILADFPADQP